jgi:hypothetical protein
MISKLYFALEKVITPGLNFVNFGDAIFNSSSAWIFFGTGYEVSIVSPDYPDSIGQVSHIDYCNLAPILRCFSDIYAFSKPANYAMRNCLAQGGYPLWAETRLKIVNFSAGM